MPGCARTPGRSCGSKRRLHNRHTEADTPSSVGQTAVLHGSHPHRQHRNDASPDDAQYRAKKIPGRPRATSPQGYEPHAGSARGPRAGMFSHGYHSSAVSVYRVDQRLANREALLSPFIEPWATLSHSTEAFSDSLLARIIHESQPRSWDSLPNVL